MRAILITAGATRNPIDSMRYISANSTGRTGAWIASQLKQHTDVTLLGSPEALSKADKSLHTVSYSSTDDLLTKMKTWVLANPDGVVIHAAAVGDYAVTDNHRETKIPSGQSELILTLVPTPKILDSIRAWSSGAVIVSFKAAGPDTTPEGLAELAQLQGLRTDSTLVFANTIGRIDSEVFLWEPAGGRWFEARQAGLEALLGAVVPLLEG